MEESEYIKVFSGTFIIVQLVMDRLESSGINAVVKEESGLGQYSGFSSANSGYQELYVSKDELEHAIPIIEAVKSDLEV
ncbi:MAG TPA: hypothetical protein VKZ98_04460 [Aquaticitalea sp.]|nr:hypothetical protein [Aquaticitalea sp.]